MNFIEKKFSVEWFIDKSWPYLLGTFGGSITTAASYLTEWIKQYGPLALVIAFFIGAALTLALYRLMLNLKMKSTIQKHATYLMSNTPINILEDRFNKQTLKVTDFFSPYYIPHKNKTITQSVIAGPGSLFLSGTSLLRCNFYDCQVVLVDVTKPVQNIICFQDSSISDSQIIGCTLFMSPQHYAEMPDALKPGLPVVSKGL